MFARNIRHYIFVLAPLSFNKCTSAVMPSRRRNYPSEIARHEVEKSLSVCYRWWEPITAKGFIARHHAQCRPLCVRNSPHRSRCPTTHYYRHCPFCSGYKCICDFCTVTYSPGRTYEYLNTCRAARFTGSLIEYVHLPKCLLRIDEYLCTLVQSNY